MKKVGIIVQARTGSSRLPGKMLRSFGGKPLLEIILNKFSDKYPVILATTSSEKDNPLVDIANRMGVRHYRGSEDDVLSRFIGSAEENNIETIVRICADNPFLNIKLLDDLLKEYNGEDYLSFKYNNGKPTILGHLGIFGEITSLETLRSVRNSTDETLYHEHVTNYIYTNPEKFKVRLIELPHELGDVEGIRLTVDTEQDFEITSKLYQRFGEVTTLIEAAELMDYIRSNSVILSSMKRQIELNSK